MEAGEICVRAPTYSCSSKHTCRDQEDWTSNSLINTFFLKIKKSFHIQDFHVHFQQILVDVCLFVFAEKFFLSVDEKIKSSPSAGGMLD